MHMNVILNTSKLRKLVLIPRMVLAATHQISPSLDPHLIAIYFDRTGSVPSAANPTILTRLIKGGILSLGLGGGVAFVSREWQKNFSKTN